MTALTPANARITELARAVLVLEHPCAVSTRFVEEHVSRRWDPAVYRALRRLENRGDAVRVKTGDGPAIRWKPARRPA